MSEQQAIDDLILQILLESEHGRRWLEQRQQAREMCDLLDRLRVAGLAEPILAQLWASADMETIRKATAMTRSQIKAVNTEYRKHVA